MDKKIINNISYLTLLQIGNYIIPLLTIPYLIKTIGVEKYGLVMLVQSIMIYLLNIVDYGFSLTGVREVSLNRSNIRKLSYIFSEILFTKIFLLLVGGIVLMMLLFFYPKLKDEGVLLVSSYLIVVGNSILPIWFFQGIEKMQFTTILTLSSKIIFASLIFIFIKTPENYIWVNTLQGMGAIISGIIGITIAIKRYEIKVVIKNTILRVINRVRENWNISLSTISISLYMNANGFILGFFVSPEILGIYMIAEKIMFTIRQLLSVFSQAIYSHVCTLHQELGKIKLFFRKTYYPFLFLVVILCILLFLFSDLLAAFLVKTQQDTLSLYIRVFSVVPIIVCMNIPFNLLLLAKNERKIYVKILGGAAAFYFVIAFLLAYFYGVIGAIIATLLTEILVTFSMARTIIKPKEQNGTL